MSPLFSPAAGWISDRVGRKWLLVLGLVVYAALGVVPFFLSDLGAIIAARFGLGVAEAIIMTVATTLIADYFIGAARERWIAAQFGVVSVSAIILIAAGGILGEALGSRGPFLLYLVAFPVALLAAVLLFEPTPSETSRADSSPLPLRGLLPILVTTLGCGVLFYTTIVKLGSILQLTYPEVSAGTIGVVGAAANGGVMLGAFTFSRFKNASGPTLLMTGLLGLSAGYLGMALATRYEVAAAMAVVAATGSGLLLPTLLNWVLQQLPEAVRGRGTGLWTGAFFLGQFVAPILASALEKPAGGLRSVLLVWAGVSIVGAAISALAARNAAPLRTLRPHSAPTSPLSAVPSE